MCDMKRLFNLQKEGGGCVTSSLYFVRGGQFFSYSRLVVMCVMKRLFDLQKEGGGCVTSSLYFVRGGSIFFIFPIGCNVCYETTI